MIPKEVLAERAARELEEQEKEKQKQVVGDPTIAPAD